VYGRRQEHLSLIAALIHALEAGNYAISALKSVMFTGTDFAAISGDVTFLAAFTVPLAGTTLKRSL
jgi:hypothetical protein